MRDNCLLDKADPKTNMIQYRHLPKFKLQDFKDVMRLHHASDISLIIEAETWGVPLSICKCLISASTYCGR